MPTSIEFVDIAGLVKGASRGEGLGNKFLGHIRAVDAIAHVVRCFDSKDIQNVNETVDPVRDLEIIETEMMLADLESIQKRLEKNNKKNIEEEQLKILNNDSISPMPTLSTHIFWCCFDYVVQCTSIIMMDNTNACSCFSTFIKS